MDDFREYKEVLNRKLNYYVEELWNEIKWLMPTDEDVNVEFGHNCYETDLSLDTPNGLTSKYILRAYILGEKVFIEILPHSAVPFAKRDKNRTVIMFLEEYIDYRHLAYLARCLKEKMYKVRKLDENELAARFNKTYRDWAKRWFLSGTYEEGVESFIKFIK